MEPKKTKRAHDLTLRDYARLATFRYALRKFLRFSEAAAAGVGITGQHYQAMLILRSSPEDRRTTINDLAQQLLIRHHSAVGLVDRLVRQDLVERQTSAGDRRKVELRLTARGQRVLARLAAVHRRELRRIGPVLKRFFAELARTERAHKD